MRKIVLGVVLLASAGAAQAVTTSTGVPAKSSSLILVPEFAQQPAPEPAPFAAAVPEPSTWALLAAGFGLVGFGLRRRRSVVATVEA